MRGGAAAFESGSERTPPPVPLCSPALRGEADAAFAAGNHDKALQLYTRLATLRPDAWPHRQLGLLARNSGDLLLARTEFLHGVALAPKSQRGWCLLANANLELGLQHDVETAARELVAATDDPVGKEDSADLTSVAHFLFENARHAIAYPIYELLLNWSDETELIRA